MHPRVEGLLSFDCVSRLLLKRDQVLPGVVPPADDLRHLAATSESVVVVPSVELEASGYRQGIDAALEQSVS
jgi:hypothetical protein